jgi:uncharacterized membrane protein YkvA (DUF1232 family)
MTWQKKLTLLFTIAYVIFPIDALPDFIPIVGWLDDLGVICLGGYKLLKKE